MTTQDDRNRDHQDLVRARELLLDAARAAGMEEWSPDEDPELRTLPRGDQVKAALRLRSAVVERNLGLAYHLAQRRARYLRFTGLVVDIEEYNQVAAEALCRAVARFDPGRSDSVGAWSAIWIAAELKRQTRDVVLGLDAALVDDLEELAGAHDPRSELARKVDAGRLLAMVGKEGKELLGQWVAGSGYARRAAQRTGSSADKARDRVRRHVDHLRRKLNIQQEPSPMDPHGDSTDANQLGLFPSHRW